MEATLSRADITYEAFFKRPILGPTDGSALESVYEALSENFAIPISDIVMNTGPVPSQVFVAINLFSGLASIEMRLDRWRGTFRALRTRSDIILVVRSLNVVANALAKMGDKFAASRASVSVGSWYKCDTGSDGVTALLSKYGSLGKEIDFGILGATAIEYAVNLSLHNMVEGWEATFLVQPSRVEGSDLFVNDNAIYTEGGRYNSIEERATHTDQLITNFLKLLSVGASIQDASA